ncbi:hypothetical protein QN277_018726 [Acacia crassicarpa]|uniref:Protein LATERAL ROOT PRIMORDIUM 1-like n=1 Tax=Acacia crassicarpa TaxID=499986 RepID=A0AAE1JV76_9FABA|nr:hypothetical protein QN277_018726 [Acacia crassicarpa]
MWSGAAARSINYGLSQDMGGGMLGLRDLYVVAPASSFHHHHHHHHHDPSVMTDPHSVNSSNPATALGVGVIPLLTTTPCLSPANIENNEATTLMSNRSRGGAIQLWQDLESEHGHYLKKQGTTMFELNDSSGNLVQNENGLTVSAANSGGVATCQDCGNQAKKDCIYRRCRTCCKSRSYDCPTHVKSTWVPESRRRERRLMAAAAAAATTAGGGGGSTGATSGAKKPRLVTSQQTTTNSHTSTSNTTPPRSFDTSSSHQDAGFKESLPGQVRAPAVFKCVRVTAVDDGQDEFAYQATVKICGHVFKGFLYDQGVEGREAYPNLSELHLGGSGGGCGRGGGGGGGNGASSSSPMLDPSDMFAASGGGLLGGGSTYGNPIN